MYMCVCVCGCVYFNVYTSTERCESAVVAVLDKMISLSLIR